MKGENERFDQHAHGFLSTRILLTVFVMLIMLGVAARIAIGNSPTPSALSLHSSNGL